jgi:FAD:protein FMN transferase
MPAGAPAPPTAARATVRRLRIEMGTTVALEAHAPTAELAASAAQAAFAAIAETARRLHPEDPDSDLVRIARAAIGEAVAIGPETFTVLSFARQLHAASEGIFDPCLPERPGRLHDLELIAAPRPAAIARVAVRLDCGGIAKGFAVDQAITILQRMGCDAGLINAGGDVRVFGDAVTTLLLREPRGTFRPFELWQAAIAVSDRDASRPTPGHRGYYRRDGQPAEPGERFAAVRAEQAMHADALTKCVLMCPARLATELLADYRAERLT